MSWLRYEEDSRPATESEAHAEWHLNAGVPMGTPGCPWDACHVDERDLHEPEEEVDYVGRAREHAGMPPVPPFDPDDVPF